MRIVLVNQYYSPSEAPTAVLAADLLETLAERGHEVHAIASSRAYNDPAKAYPRRQRLCGVEVWRTRTSAFGRAGKLGRMVDYVTFLLGAMWRLRRLPKPDLVIAMTTPPMLVRLVAPICRRRGARLLYWAMDLYPDVAFALGVLRADGWIGRALRGAADRSIRTADRVVALGDRMAECLRAQGARRVDVVDNWCDDDAIRPRARAGHATRRAYGWDDKFVLMYAGNIGLAHEFDTLLEAAAGLADRSDVVFAFVGGGARAAEVERGARVRGLGSFEFHPWVSREHLPDLLTAGDVHLITLREGLEGLLVPSKIYGVLAAGRPTLYVGPERSEVAWIVTRAHCGAVVRVGDSAQLAGWIRRYADTPALREEHGKAARQALDRVYPRERTLEKLVEIVESCGTRQ